MPPSDTNTSESERARPLPGRPRADGRPPITRQKVLAAAAALIAERGFSDTSIRMIADLLQARPSSIFHHFPSKDLILDVLVNELFEAERRFAHQVVNAKLAPDVTLYKLIYEDLLVGSKDNLVLQRIFLLPELRSGRFPLAAEHWNELVIVYNDIIIEGQKQGIFIPCDGRAAAEGLFNLLSTPLVGFTSWGDGDVERFASTLASIGVRGMLTDPGRMPMIIEQAAALPVVMEPFKIAEDD